MEKRHFTENQKKLIGGVAIVIFVVFSAAICWFVGKPMVKFVSEPEKFRMWVDSHGLWSQVAYVGMTLLQVLVAVIPGEPLEISGGSAGSWWRFSFLRRRSSLCVFCRAPLSGICCSGSYSLCRGRPRICCATLRD